MTNKNYHPFFTGLFPNPALAGISFPVVEKSPVPYPGQIMFSNQDGDSVDVHRRREGVTGGPSGRADAPGRRRDDSGSSSGGGGRPSGDSSGSGGGGWIPSSQGGSPSGGMRLPWWMVVIVLIGYFIYSTFFPGSQDASQPAGDQTAVLPNTFSPTATALPLQPTVAFTPPAASSSGGRWLVMLYQDADDQILEEDIFTDLNEAERVGSTDRVAIVSQIDRYKGAFSGDGNWTDARRYYVTKDNDLKHLNSKLLADIGEVNMADGNTLVDFVTWAVKTFPSEHYVLILSDHGMGWPGGWTDADPGGKDASNTPIASAIGDAIYMPELEKALADIRTKTGINKLDMIGMDACLMSHVEVFTALAPYARYAVASQETEPALGWAYTSFLKSLTENPDIDGVQLGKLIVQSYIKDDQRIVDDTARAEFMHQGSSLGGLFGSGPSLTANQLANQIGQDATLTAVDLSTIAALNKSVNDLALALKDDDQALVAQARNYAQSLTSIFGDKVPPSYIDLGNFAAMLKKESTNKAVGAAADRVTAAIKQAILAEKHGSGKPGATGISIYFPNSALYRSSVAGPESYTAVASRFAKESLWDDFLLYHYTKRPFDTTSTRTAVPDASTPVRAPGAGQITVSALTLSGTTAAPGQPIDISAQVKGSNIGYIYLFVGYYDKASNSIAVVDTDYLESADTRQVAGVFYPVWSSSFTMKLSWDPTVFTISDGKKSVLALFQPEQYGLDKTQAIYTVDGTYTYVVDKQTRPARLYFRNGLLEAVYGFTDQQDAGAPREIIPQAGDTFTIQESWLDLDSSGKVTQSASQQGDTLTFGSQTFKWEEKYAAAGSYVVGFIVEDMDGNRQQVYNTVTVK